MSGIPPGKNRTLTSSGHEIKIESSRIQDEAGAEEKPELRRRDAAWRRSGTEAEEKPKLRQSGGGMRWTALSVGASGESRGRR
jgi:hypothetical protein